MSSEKLRRFIALLGIVSLVAGTAVLGGTDAGADLLNGIVRITPQAESDAPAPQPAATGAPTAPVASAASVAPGGSPAPVASVAAAASAALAASPAPAASAAAVALAAPPASAAAPTSATPAKPATSTASSASAARGASVAPAVVAMASLGAHRIYALTLNGERAGSVSTIVRADDILVHAKELEAARFAAPAAARVNVEGDEYVSLQALLPGTKHVLDTSTDALAITAPADMFRPQHVAVQPPAVSGNPTASGAYVNYGVGVGSDSGLSTTAQMGAAFAGGLLESTISRDAVSHTRVSGTAFTLDDFARARRTVFGDSFVDVNDFAGLGGGLNLRGVSMHRLLSYNPGLFRQAANGFSGYASTPSTVDVYVNGSLVAQEHVNPGPFQLSNLPLDNGVNHTRVVIRDAFGHVEEIERPVYLTGDLLPRGQYEYEMGVGRDADYGGFARAFRYQRGITDRLTLAARGLETGRVSNAGGSIVLGTGLGELSLAGAWSSARTDAQSNTTVIGVSSDPLAFATATPPPDASLSPVGGMGDRLSGHAYAASFSRNANRFSGGVTYVWQSPQYASTATSPLDDRPVEDARAFAKFDLGGPKNRSISLNAQRTIYRDAQPLRSLTIGFSEKITQRIKASIAVGSAALGSLVRPSVQFALSIMLRGETIGYTSETTNGRVERHADIEHRTSGQFGTSYQARVGTTDDQVNDLFTIESRAPWGALDLTASRWGTMSNTSATFSGSLVRADGRWFASRNVGDAFAVVETGVPFVDVKANGIPIGRTDRFGRLLAPNLSSNQDNVIELDAKALPKGAPVEATSLVALPAYHAGTILRFTAKRARPVSGHLHMHDAPQRSPENGHFDVETRQGTATTVVGPLGAFTFEELPPGTYDGTVLYAGGKCKVHLVVPQVRQQRTDLGDLLCKPES